MELMSQDFVNRSEIPAKERDAAKRRVFHESEGLTKEVDAKIIDEMK